MKSLLLFVIIVTGIATRTYAQVFSVYGIVQNTYNQPLQHVPIDFTSPTEHTSVISDSLGNFQFIKVSSDNFILTFFTPGADSNKIIHYHNSNNTVNFNVGIITLPILAEVIIKSPSVLVKDDTTEYSINTTSLKKGSLAKDAIRMLPGILLDRNGDVIVQGKVVRKIMLNGNYFLGGDVKTALENLPADIISKIQVVDVFDDKTRYTGFKEGESQKTINIVTKANKSHGYFGNITVGYGSAYKYANNAILSKIKKARQLTVLINDNNTSENNLSYADGGQNGINTLRSASLSYQSTFNHFSLSGNYSANANSQLLNSTSTEQDFNLSNSRITQKNNRSVLKLNSIVANNVGDYIIDTNNVIKLQSNFSLSSSAKNTQNYSVIKIPGISSNYFNTYTGQNFSGSIDNNLSYNHHFNKKGRNLNIDVSFHLTVADDNDLTSNRSLVYDSTQSDTCTLPIIKEYGNEQKMIEYNYRKQTNIHISYVEPICGNTYIELNCNFNNFININNHNITDLDTSHNERYAPALSSHINSTNNQYESSIILKSNNNKNTVSLTTGLALQDNRLRVAENTTNAHSYLHFLPTATLNIKLNSRSQINIKYDKYVLLPNYLQLRTSIDSSNIYNITIGNSALKPELTTRVGVIYNHYNFENDNNFDINCQASIINNKIINKTSSLPTSLVKTFTYENVNGQFNLYGYIQRGIPIIKRKIKLTLGANYAFNRNISYNNNDKLYTLNVSIKPSIVLSIDKNKFNADVFGDYSINRTIGNSLLSKPLITGSVGLKGRIYLTKCFTFGYTVSTYFYQHTTIGHDIAKNLNLYFEYAFLKNKNASVRLQATDIFGENYGVIRYISNNTVTDNIFNNSNKFYLLSLNIKLQRFS